MSTRCPHCGYPVRGRPDYVDLYDPLTEDELPLDQSLIGDDSVLGQDLSSVEDYEDVPWWKIWRAW